MAENDYRLQLTADLSQLERGLAQITNQLAGVIGGLNETDSAIKKTEGSTKSAADSQGKFSTSLNSTRYALYDVSRTLLVAGAALLAFAVAPTKVAIDFQREFANVQRTVEGAGDAIKSQLVDLSTQIPATFKNLTEIATLGGQLGVGSKGIVDFTETVAKLTATTNLSAEVAGTALGRFLSFGLVTSSQFENLASAILKVGVNSVATESQITGIATGIAGIGKVAGLSAATLIGYAGALASVGVQQYAARGTTQRFITEIQKAASTGGESLDTLAKISGYSAEKIKTSFGTQAFNPIFQSLIKNLGDTKRTGTDLNTTLADLGINSVIDRRTLLQLAAAPGVVSQAFKDANSGIKDGTTLNQQYGRVAETTAAKLQEFANSIQALFASIGDSTTGPIGQFVDGLKDMVNGIREFISTPFGQSVAVVLTTLSALAGVLLLAASVAARGAATMIGLSTAIGGLNAQAATGTGIMATLNAQLTAMGSGGRVAAAGLTAASVAMKGLTFGAIAGGVVIGASLISGALDDILDKAKGWSNDLPSLIKRATDSSQSNLLEFGTGAKQSFLESTAALDDLTRGVGRFLANANFGDEASRQVKLLDDQLAALAKNGDVTNLNKSLNQLSSATGLTGENLTKNFPALRDAAKDANIQLQVGVTGWEAYTKASKEAAAANAEFADSSQVSNDFLSQLMTTTGLDAKGMEKFAQGYQKSVGSLTDFNSVVKSVQDGLKASADAQAAASDGAVKASDLYDGSSVSLQQFTDQLNTNNQAQATWAANLVQVATQYGPEAAQQFINAGYTAVNASILQQLVDASPEQAAAYIAAQQQAAQLASDATATALLASGFLVTNAGGAIGKDTAAKLAQGIQLGLPVEQLMQSLNLRLAGTPLVPVVNPTPAKNTISNIIAYGNSQTIRIPVDTYGRKMTAVNPGGGFQGFASGGHVRGAGTGTSDSIPARLSNGEYVIKASRVRQLGVSYLDSLNGGRSTRPGHFADGGPVSSSSNVGSGIVEFGPNTMNAMRGMIQREIVVAIGSEGIARAANSGNKSINRRGGM